MNDDALRAAKAASILAVLFTGVAFATHGGRAGLSVFLGAAVAIANLLTMRLIIRALVRDPSEKAGDSGSAALWGVLAVVKAFVLFGVLGVLLTKRLVDPMPLAIGYGVMPLGITLGAIWAALRPPEA